MREERQVRSTATNFETRVDGEDLIIEGYFAVYNSIYQIAPDMSESIAPGAFGKTLSGDIRALINHDTTLVLGRTAAGTMTLRDDTHGLWASIKINPKDLDAMNLHARVLRGDVSQCSIGFVIREEETDLREDGSVHWTIKEAELFEVSVCTFPAYEETNVSARERDRDEIRKRSAQAWREKMTARLGGI